MKMLAIAGKMLSHFTGYEVDPSLRSGGEESR
jgi:hypothetical protein